MKIADRRWISVTAEGEATVAPDLAVVSFAVTGQGSGLGPAREDVLRRSTVVLGSLRELGIAEADLNAPDVTIQPQYDYRRGQKLVGYQVTRQMTAKVRTIEQLGDAMDRIVAAGANEVHGAEMRASDPSAAEHQALEAAVAAARAKAKALAKAAGVTLGPVTRIEEEPALGVGPMPRVRTVAAAAESADVSTEVAAGDLTVIRRIRAWFAIA
jgi:uncharacterized protein YggE